MKQKIFIMIALLCAVAQGAWADDGWSVWDGKSMDAPEIETVKDDVYTLRIKSAAQLAYIRENFTYRMSELWPEQYAKQIFYLDVNIDMGDSWTHIGKGEDFYSFRGKFYGRGHTIRIRGKDYTENYQGLFAQNNGEIYDLHVDGYVACKRSRLVGTIAGENNGTIRNC